MLPQLLQKASLFFLLYRIDMDLAEQVQSKGCPFCHCTLHHANYTRKPRGGPVNIPRISLYVVGFSNTLIFNEK